MFDFYFNANLTLPALKSKLTWNFSVVSVFKNSNCIVYNVACNSVAPKRSRNINKTSRQSMLWDKLRKSINFQSLRGLFCRYILHLVIRNKYLVLLNSRTPSSCVQFLYSSRKTNDLNSWLTKKSVSLLKYQDRYVPFGLF